MFTTPKEAQNVILNCLAKEGMIRQQPIADHADDHLKMRCQVNDISIDFVHPYTFNEHQAFCTFGPSVINARLSWELTAGLLLAWSGNAYNPASERSPMITIKAEILREEIFLSPHWREGQFLHSLNVATKGAITAALWEFLSHNNQ
jgi:hypothetical protein